MGIRKFAVPLISALAVAFSHPLWAEDKAEIKDAQAFDALASEFSKAYTQLELPDLELSFITNLENLGSAEALSHQQSVFTDLQSQLTRIDQQALDVCRKIDYSIMSDEIELGLRRADLGLRFVEQEVDLSAVKSINELAMGEAWYGYFLDRWNSARLEPDALYQFGEAQLKRSVARYDAIQAQLGFSGDDEGFAKHLANYSQTLHDGEAILALFRQKQARVWARMYQLFPQSYGVFPARIKLSELGEDFPVEGYYEPTEETFYFNLLKKGYEERQTDWLYLHEGSPGHHFQIRAERVGKRCETQLPSMYSPAYSEGWAAYTENLGEALGLYTTPEAKLAGIEWDMVRSVRVVLDVALNQYGWSDQQALDYWHAHVRGQKHLAQREIDRMRRWPAQVITYKYGANVFETVKAQYLKTAENQEAAVKAFHDAAIAYGAMPLRTFEELFPDLVKKNDQASER